MKKVKQPELSTASLMLVEDSEEDAELLKHCLKNYKIHVHLDIFTSGEDGLDFLKGKEKMPIPNYPNLILLDINLPGLSGIEVLEQIKNNPKTAMIPVAMLTSSQHEEDIVSSYTNHANCFVQKPVDLKSFEIIVKSFEEFWFTVVTLPSDARIN